MVPAPVGQNVVQNEEQDDQIEVNAQVLEDQGDIKVNLASVLYLGQRTSGVMAPKVWNLT